MSTQRSLRTGSRRTGGMLGAWINGQLVGHWELRPDGQQRFQYEGAWLASLAARRLSLSMPLSPANLPHTSEAVGHFFDNLLPCDDALRQRLQGRFSTLDTGAFELLEAVGRDCAGALLLLPGGQAPAGWDGIEAEPLTDAQVASLLDEAADEARAGAARQGLPQALPGRTPKIALLRHEGRWCRPLGATGSTHILKLAPAGAGAAAREALANEWLCGRLLRALGLPVAPAELARFGRHQVLVVERFDRILSTTAAGRPWLARLPQEDFCQALGLPWRARYEAEGGPGITALLRILETSSRAEADKLELVAALLAFWLLAAVDGHGKKFSLFLERNGRYRLAPFYGVRSAWPASSGGSAAALEMAMALPGEPPVQRLGEIRTRHWQALAEQAGTTFATLVEMVARVPDALEAVQAQLPKGFPTATWEAVRAGVLAQSLRFAAGLA